MAKATKRLETLHDLEQAVITAAVRYGRECDNPAPDLTMRAVERGKLLEAVRALDIARARGRYEDDRP